jgi:hypothetical protein
MGDQSAKHEHWGNLKILDDDNDDDLMKLIEHAKPKILRRN